MAPWSDIGKDLLERGSSALVGLTSSLSRDEAAAKQAVRRLPAAGSVPGPRESHSITPIGPKLYVFGGFDGGRVLNDLHVFDSHAGLWTQLVHTGISPAARAGHTATALGVPAHLVVFGGANSSRRFADVQLFDTTDDHWTKPAVRGRPPAPRYYHCACLARGSLLVLGGNDGAACLGDLHALNTESWTWSQPLATGVPPSPRCGATTSLVNKLVFVVGGVEDGATNASNSRELGDIFVLDTDTWAWWRPDVSPPLPPIAYHATALVADQLFLFGGSTRDALYNDMIMLDTASCTWQVRGGPRTRPTMPMRDHRHLLLRQPPLLLPHTHSDPPPSSPVSLAPPSSPVSLAPTPKNTKNHPVSPRPLTCQAHRLRVWRVLWRRKLSMATTPSCRGGGDSGLAAAQAPG